MYFNSIESLLTFPYCNIIILLITMKIGKASHDKASVHLKPQTLKVVYK